MNGCKLDHGAEGEIPQFLCRTCTPRKTLKAPPPAPKSEADKAAEQAATVKSERRQRRKLKAEVKRLEGLRDQAGRHMTKSVAAKLEKRITDARVQLHLAS